jgi:hypothetical protein
VASAYDFRVADLVNEAVKRFTADSDRQPYQPGDERLVVSPETRRIVSRASSAARANSS